MREASGDVLLNIIERLTRGTVRSMRDRMDYIIIRMLGAMFEDLAYPYSHELVTAKAAYPAAAR